MRLLLAISIMLCLCIGGAQEVFAQKPKPENLRKYDRQWIHFGFLLGINSADFNVHPSPNIRDFDSIYVVESDPESGFTLGIVANLRLGHFFDLRAIPSLSFSQRQLEYTLVGTNKIPKMEIKKIESTFLEFPLTIKYKSVRINNGRAFVLGGLRYSLDLASQKDVSKEDEELVKLKRDDFLYEIGFGMDFYLKYFKLSPVIMLSLGLNNMLVREEDNLFSSSIDKLNTKVIQFAVTFE
ncbi:MAG: PorT family protein [Flavobacteriales bacterium]|nr:PorT family protein [Flavobacteriales bacterium]